MTGNLLTPQRVERCQAALDRYSDENPFVGLMDLLADAMHWCHANGQDLHYALCVAGKHFVNELNLDSRDSPAELAE